MYCFLCPLALVDVGFTTSVVPPLLVILHNLVLSLELVGAWCSCRKFLRKQKQQRAREGTWARG